ncbi:MAG: hypothetical protein INF84_12710 [Roseomonas sp.]|nr:hypothetical protein [Roseomonas sp.]
MARASSLNNLTPADVYFGRGQTILLERERIKCRTIQQRSLTSTTDGPDTPLDSALLGLK